MFQPQPAPLAASSFHSFSIYDLEPGPAQILTSLYPTGGGAGFGSPSTAGAASAAVSNPPPPSSSVLRLLPASNIQQRRIHGQHHQPLQTQQHHRDRHSGASSNMEDQDPNPHNMAAQQAAAEGYQPVLDGPFVGEKTPSDVITHEYAKADPAYVEKTIALPQTYSHYRPIKGDGNCGWRAIAFGYFEKLLDVGDQGQIEGEVARLTSLGSMLANTGGYAYYDDFAEPVIDLLRELATHADNPGLARVILLQRFNDGSEASIIYYFRMLAATYLKAHAESYDSFIPDGGGIAAHCSQVIEIVNREIDNLGVVGLANILLKPIDFVLEIAYLDRSQGSEVNRYRFPEEAEKLGATSLGPTIYLLYRPDHYDILYREAQPLPVAAPAAPVSLQVNRMDRFSANIAITTSHGSPATFAGTDIGLLSMMPGFGGNGLGAMGDLTSLASPGQTASPVGEAYAPSQQQQPQPQQSSPWMSRFPDSLPAQIPNIPSHQPPPVVSPGPLTPNHTMTPSPTMVGASHLGGAHSTALAPSQSIAPAAGYHIRFSPVQLEYEECKRSGFQEPPFQTATSSTFKNSVWNRAHYGNPDFHPEEYVPEEEHSDGRGARKRTRKDS